MRSSSLGFLLFSAMILIFFILPNPEGVQKPFRIGLGLVFAATYFALLLKKELEYKTLWPVAIGGILLLILFYRGTLQSSFVNAYCCLFGLLVMPTLLFKLTPTRLSNINYLHILAIISILVQLMVFRSHDGRPRLSYEINLSGAYLFLFFILSDILNNKHGKLLVVLLSLVLLSRLLIFSLLLFYLVRYLKPYFKVLILKLSATHITVAGYVLFSIFSLWSVSYMTFKAGDYTDVQRVANLNDESNFYRFQTNNQILGAVARNPLDKNILFGIGSVEEFNRINKKEMKVPHNELFDGIVEFGLLAVLLFSLISLPLFNKVTSYANMEIFIPVLFYTLILWVRFLIVPSFEMLFILFMLHIANTDKQLITNTNQN